MTGATGPDQRRAGNQAKKPAFNDIPRDFTLMVARRKWRARAKGGANEDFDNLMVLSTALRHGKGVKMRSNVADWTFAPEQVGPLLDKESNFLLSAAKNALPGGTLDKCEKILLDKYKTAVLALRQYAHGSATFDQVKASVRGFTNLKLFVNHGGDLHSSEKGNKLERTLAKIPEIVFRNASPDVTVSDYTKADLQKTNLTWTGRQQRLLSFHGFKATDSWFGMDNKSRAYREDLRALTASALVLGGDEKALEVKQLLTSIDDNPVFGTADIKKEDMAKNALEKLATHGDVDALIDDLKYKLQRRELLGAIWYNCWPRYGRRDLNRFYSDVLKEMEKLDKTPHRMTVARNLADSFNDAGRRDYYVHHPHQLVRTLRNMSRPDPIRFVVRPDDRDKRKANAKPALDAVVDWISTMTPLGSREQADLSLAIKKLEQKKHKRNRDHALYYAARAFAFIDKSRMSVEDQSSVLLSCLKNPFADGSVHLRKVASQKAAQNLAQDVKQEAKIDIVEVSANEQEDKTKHGGDGKYDIDQAGLSPVRHAPDPHEYQSVVLDPSWGILETVHESLDDNGDSGGDIEDGDSDGEPEWAPILEAHVAAGDGSGDSVDNDAKADNPDRPSEPEKTVDVKEDIPDLSDLGGLVDPASKKDEN